jgi:ferredoxin
MKVRVDRDRCAGHGVCAATVPGVFAFNDDGSAIVTDREIPDQLADLVRESASQCPQRAITVEADGEPTNACPS